MTDRHPRTFANTEAKALTARTVWRWMLGAAAMIVLLGMYVSYKAVRGINGYYFHDPSVSVSAFDIAVGAAWVYILAVALSGRWLIARKFPKVRGTLR